MTAVILSPRFQVVIPKKVRRQLRLSPGQRIEVIAYGDRIELVPIRPIKRMRGFLKGLDTRVPREEDRG